MMMVSANDAAYAIADTRRRQPRRVRDRSQRDREALGMRDSTLGDPAGLDDAHVVQGRPEVSAYDLAIATRNALAVPEIAKWADTTHVRRSSTRPACTTTLVNHNKLLPGQRLRLPRRDRVQDRLHRDRAQHTLVATAKRNGRTLHRGDPRLVRQRLHVGGVAARRSAGRSRARRDDRRDAAAGRGVAVRDPRRRPGRASRKLGAARSAATTRPRRPPATTPTRSRPRRADARRPQAATAAATTAAPRTKHSARAALGRATS